MTNAENEYFYVPLLRPATKSALPNGRFRFVEIPSYFVNNPFGLPVSVHTHGMIAFDRDLTCDEIKNFDLSPVAS